MSRNDPTEKASLITAMKENVRQSTSNFASISPLFGVFNLLCIGEGKQASDMYDQYQQEIMSILSWYQYLIFHFPNFRFIRSYALSIDNIIRFLTTFYVHIKDLIKMKYFVHKQPCNNGPFMGYGRKSKNGIHEKLSDGDVTSNHFCPQPLQCSGVNPLQHY